MAGLIRHYRSYLSARLARLSPRHRMWCFGALLILCLLPVISAPLALLLGVVAATLNWLPTGHNTTLMAKKLLGWSIGGLGFGIPLELALSAGQQGLLATGLSVAAVMALGIWLGRWLKLEHETSLLITAGTAICGGSAIAALAPVTRAGTQQISVALATVFVFNTLALFSFPLLGHLLGLSQQQFGVWSAIGIHAISSVVGAGATYGDQALQVATTMKLIRVLWLLPLLLVVTWSAGAGRKAGQQTAGLPEGSSESSERGFRSRGEHREKRREKRRGKGKSSRGFPLFMLSYCVAIVIAWLLPQFAPLYGVLFFISKRLMVVCLFLVGCGITLARLREAGPAPLVLGGALWLLLSAGSLISVLLMTQ